VRAHLERVPFENISKLYYLKTRGLRAVPELPLYLDGIEQPALGGTCYSNNPYLCELLRWLGYDVSLCGADMSAPDVHTALRVRLGERSYHVDVGYGAPFFEPVPRDATGDFAVALGNERWVFRPPDEHDRTVVEHHRDGAHVHGYTAKPQPRDPAFFREIIERSFAPDAHFMTCVRIVRFHGAGYTAIADLALVEATGDHCSITKLSGRGELLEVIEQRFGMPADIAGTALAGVAAADGPAR